MNPEPDIFQYLDYRAWMRDWFAARKGRSSLRGFARRAHCSAALVSSIVNGRRALDTGRAEVFARTMHLDDAQTAHFVSLVALAHDPSSQRRTHALDAVLTTRRFRGARRITEAALVLLSDPELATILELARCVAWRDDPAWVAQALRPPITRHTAAHMLELLKAEGVLVPDAAGTLRITGDQWATEHDVHVEAASLDAERFHRRILARAPDALATVPPSERQFAAITFAVPPDAVPEIKARINRFYEELMHLVEKDQTQRDRVYQLCMQFYPVAMASLDEPDA